MSMYPVGLQFSGEFFDYPSFGESQVVRDNTLPPSQLIGFDEYEGGEFGSLFPEYDMSNTYPLVSEELEQVDGDILNSEGSEETVRYGKSPRYLSVIITVRDGKALVNQTETPSTCEDELQGNSEDISPTIDKSSDVYSSEYEQSSVEERTTLRLPKSKTPVLDAFVYCAHKQLSISTVRNDTSAIEFKVRNWKKLLKKCDQLINKQQPTQDTCARLKTFRRWFDGVPGVRAIEEDLGSCVVTVKKDKKNTLAEVIEKIGDFIKNQQPKII